MGTLRFGVRLGRPARRRARLRGSRPSLGCARGPFRPCALSDAGQRGPRPPSWVLDGWFDRSDTTSLAPSVTREVCSPSPRIVPFVLLEACPSAWHLAQWAHCEPWSKEADSGGHSVGGISGGRPKPPSSPSARRSRPAALSKRARARSCNRAARARMPAACRRNFAALAKSRIWSSVGVPSWGGSMRFHSAVLAMTRDPVLGAPGAISAMHLPWMAGPISVSTACGSPIASSPP